jgi:amidohydrolase
VTYNDPALSERMLPTLQRAAGSEKVLSIPAVLGAEDFAFFQKEVPGLFVFIGTRPKGVTAAEAAPNHSPRFYIDESGLPLGVRTLSMLALDYLESQAKTVSK